MGRDRQQRMLKERAYNPKVERFKSPPAIKLQTSRTAQVASLRQMHRLMFFLATFEHLTL
jgi:hypothetical protein